MEYLDLFKVNFQFNIYKASLFSTRFSQTSSILFIVVSIFTFIWNFTTMFQRSIFNINSYRTNINKNEKTIFNETNSFLGFSLKKDILNGDIPKNSTILKYIRINSYSMNLSYNNMTLINLSLINCNETFNKNFFNSFPIIPNYCVDFNNSFTLNNYFSTDDLTFFFFSIEFDREGYLRETNDNLTDNILGYLYFYYQISSINLENYTSPFNITMGYYYYPFYANMPQTNIISYDITEIHTDSSYMGKNDNIDQVLSNSYNFQPYNGGQFQKGTIFELQFIIYPIKTLYFRRYMKFQDVINNTNSSVSIIFLVFNLLCSSFNKIKLKHKFIEENILYQVDFSRDDIYKIDKNSGENKFGVKEEDIKEDDLKSDEDRGKEIIQLKSIKVKKDSIEHYKELEIADHMAFYINLLSCIWRKPKFGSNNFVIKSIYDYYESIIDVRNILIRLYGVEKFIKNYGINSIEKKFLLNIALKNKQTNNQNKKNLEKI